MTEIQRKSTGTKRLISVLCASFFFAVKETQISISMVSVFFMHNLLKPNISDFLTPNKCWMNRKTCCTSPYCTSSVSHNAPYGNKMCAFLLQNGALWVICPMPCGICEMITFMFQWMELSALWVEFEKSFGIGVRHHSIGEITRTTAYPSYAQSCDAVYIDNMGNIRILGTYK